MRENRTYGSEGGEIGSTDLPYPYRTAERRVNNQVANFDIAE